MSEYNENDLIHLAKRFNNKKRNFLLINPLQSKHMPVSPKKSLKMIEILGEKVVEKHPNAKLVIGFAETATAIGFVVAKALGEECNYITTTRENLGKGSYFEFKEEHSHAVDQRLYDENLEKYIYSTDEIILVDDELTTGKTVLNFINQLKVKYPIIAEKKIIAVSIINRITDENLEKLRVEKVYCEYLIKPKNADYETFVEQFDIGPQVDFHSRESGNIKNIDIVQVTKFENHISKGVNSEAYTVECEAIAKEVLDKILDRLKKDDDILVLGTEEFMYPAIILGRLIEDENCVKSVSCHATTRSPIGICNDEIYPIKNGYKLNSFYEKDRETYVYNLKNYDKVVVFTDSMEKESKSIAIKKLANILESFCVKDIIFVEGGFNV